MSTDLPRRPGAAVPPPDLLSYDDARGRWVLLATVLGSGVAMLDATVVNIALPAIAEELDAGMGGLQWTINGYTLTLAAFILLGGSLGDRYGRRRLFVIGVVWFAAASLLCGLAPNVTMLVLARALQGIGGALLTPGSLAIIQASFRPGDRARAIGAWSGLGGIAGAIGPFLGGWLIDVATWRLVFLINVPLAVVVVLVAVRHVPESADPQAPRHLDLPGAVLCAAGLAGVTYGLIAWSGRALSNLDVVGPLVLGVAGLVAFVLVERRSPQPMLPLGIFASREFTAANLVTFVVYGALGGVFFLLVVALQVVAGFSPLVSGSALLPVTLILLALSARAGALSQRIGPRLPMTLGPIVSAVGLVLLTRIGPGAGYWVDVLPGVIVFGLGLSLLVAPLTTTVLAAADDRHAGVASGVNNAVARAAGLLAVAALPLVIGLTTAVYEDPPAFASAFARAMWLCAVLLVAGGVLSWLAIRNPLPATPAVAGAAPGSPIGSGPADVDGVRGSAQGSPGALAGGHRPDLAPDGTPPGGVRAASAPADGAHAAPVLADGAHAAPVLADGARAAPVLADGARAGGPDADLAPAESACRVCDPTVPAVPVRPRP